MYLLPTIPPPKCNCKTLGIWGIGEMEWEGWKRMERKLFSRQEWRWQSSIMALENWGNQNKMKRKLRKSIKEQRKGSKCWTMTSVYRTAKITSFYLAHRLNHKYNTNSRTHSQVPPFSNTLRTWSLLYYKNKEEHTSSLSWLSLKCFK